MSVNLEYRVVGPGSDQHVGDAWELKERIREAEGVLKQRRGFFSDAFRRSTVHLYLTGEDTIVGYAAVRRDGYILFLAVTPEFRGEGVGARLVADVASDNRTVSCHARTTNDDALGFYEAVGFTVKRRIDSYYEDGGDAYYLTLGDGDGLTRKLSRLMGR